MAIGVNDYVHKLLVEAQNTLVPPNGVLKIAESRWSVQRPAAESESHLDSAQDAQVADQVLTRHG